MGKGIGGGGDRWKWESDKLEMKSALGTLSKTNYGIIWEFFPSGGPPPPLLGTPYSKKKFIVYFAF